MTQLEAIRADITTLAVDVIVNAANSALRGGGGVDGAIRRAAGPDLDRACRALGGCATGSAKITPGFRLPARYVTHAVGPVWQGGGADEDAQLASCYRAALQLAADNRLASIAFPSISTGIYGFPADRAAKIAVTTVAEITGDGTSALEKVIFCCFDEAGRLLHRAAIAELGVE